MSIQILKRRTRVTRMSYQVHFEDDKGSGYSFPADKNFNVNMHTLPKPARRNFARLSVKGVPMEQVMDEGRLLRRSFETYENNYWESAWGYCEVCNGKVYLGGFTNTCHKCGAEYSMSGQRLAPRSQWGWETGETADEIERPFRDPENFSD